MTINYIAIILLTIISFIGGYAWFSQMLFGKTWMMIHGSDKKTPEEVKMSMKGMLKFLITEFILTLVMTYFLYIISIQSVSVSSALITAFYLWLGFVLPTNISTVIWGGDERRWMFKKIVISSSFRLIVMLLSTWIFFIW